MGSCSNIHISNTNIGTRYDCIVILSGTTNLDISNVKCGSVHGINVGSLGKNKDEKDVKHLTGESHVQIQDIKLKNIYGTSKNIVAVNLQCSKSFPCKNVELIDINLKHTGLEKGHSKGMCENVDGSVRGRMVSQHCLD
ncbi:unnamed protein product [Arabidopsis thaliana]|uniref:Pectin lyase-like superfamily protein n=1 Tax=Arabidopsis thaliana TaxID=3702 RepID=A0A654ERL4_ARATH|nr:unnamed protein product [Arabidopsis thaliana]